MEGDGIVGSDGRSGLVQNQGQRDGCGRVPLCRVCNVPSCVEQNDPASQDDSDSDSVAPWKWSLRIAFCLSLRETPYSLRQHSKARVFRFLLSHLLYSSAIVCLEMAILR